MTMIDILLVVLLIFSLPFIFYILAVLWLIIEAIPFMIIGKVAEWRDERKRRKRDEQRCSKISGE